MKHLDKLKHLGLFAVATLVALYFAGLMFPTVNESFRVAAVGLLAAAAAFWTEDMQRKKVGRVKDGWDAFADMLGFVFGVLTFDFLVTGGWV